MSRESRGFVTNGMACDPDGEGENRRHFDATASVRRRRGLYGLVEYVKNESIRVEIRSEVKRETGNVLATRKRRVVADSVLRFFRST